jgi:hypothetical protein
MTKTRRPLALINPEILLPFATLFCVSGLNYIYFLLFTQQLSQEMFLDFSASIAVFMFAMAVAESGMIYSAPPFLKRYSRPRAARIAGGFLVLSYAILVIVAILGGMTWSIVGKSQLDLTWLLRYGLIASPNLLLQSWILIRLKSPFLFLLPVSLLRAAPLLAIQSLPTLDVILTATFCLVFSAFVVITWRTGVMRLPTLSDLVLCTRVTRSFFAVRFFSTIVTSSAPLLLGVVASGEAAAAYLIGDRTRTLIGAAFQPVVQGLYLLRCRPAAYWNNQRIALVAWVTVGFAVLLSIGLAFSAETVNQLLFASRHPDPTALAMFIVAGHVSVLASLGYFLVLIPEGHASAFVRSAMGQAALFLVLILTLTTVNPIRNPAFSALAAELFLLFAVLTTIAYFRAHSKPATQIPSPLR